MNHINEGRLFKRALIDLLSSSEKGGLEDIAATARRGDDRTVNAGGVWRYNVAVSSNSRKFPAVVVGRLSPKSIAVRWSDPRSGYYGEQTWRACQSQKRAICAATGLTIRRGDTVFKPATRGGMQPFNRDELILASGVFFHEISLDSKPDY
ncbi:DUF3331 domain-containing protein (plasmid) [Paraburkholderia sp. PREW-6R]|uniref:DUF3331 domain-containing protein n=1 Tax=Paraburkholderia sp. PREW-6R TaxID=3141544 RepID=UPI0031F4DF01